MKTYPEMIEGSEALNRFRKAQDSAFGAKERSLKPVLETETEKKKAVNP